MTLRKEIDGKTCSDLDYGYTVGYNKALDDIKERLEKIYTDPYATGTAQDDIDNLIKELGE